MRNLSILILKWLRPDLWENYSTNVREDYIADLTNHLTLYIGDMPEYVFRTSKKEDITEIS